MRTRLVLGLAAALLVGPGCTADTFPTPPPATGDAGGSVNPVGGGDAGAGVDAAPPPGCDGSKLPTDDACVVNDAYGVFVSSSMGLATNPGTKASPLGSLDAAIALAKKSNKRVYACAETYAEQVHFQDGVSVFGYFDCGAGWTIGSSHAKVAAPASPAATAASIATATRVENVDLVSPDFTSGAQSSIALLATSSPALTIKNATIHAGTGGKGTDGANAVQLSNSGNENGQNAWSDGVCGGTICSVVVYGSPSGGTNTCAGANGYVGGSGGNGGAAGKSQSQLFMNGYTWNNVQPATVGYPTAPSLQTAQGGSWGQAGAAGAPGASGSNGLTGSAIGTLSANGYSPSDGTEGTAGEPGQGGGGAGAYGSALQSDYPPGSYPSYVGWNEPGAGGGAGGCPGLAGTAGRGGGASISIIAVASPFTLDHVTLESSAGGAGGAAGLPSAPTAGGAGGKAYFHTAPGGHGGTGGNAGVSGNGGGGPSIGIASQGTAPTQLATTITVAAGGSGVAARTANGSTIPASPDGLSAKTYAF